MTSAPIIRSGYLHLPRHTSPSLSLPPSPSTCPYFPWYLSAYNTTYAPVIRNVDYQRPRLTSLLSLPSPFLFLLFALSPGIISVYTTIHDFPFPATDIISDPDKHHLPPPLVRLLPRYFISLYYYYLCVPLPRNGYHQRLRHRSHSLSPILPFILSSLLSEDILSVYTTTSAPIIRSGYRHLPRHTSPSLSLPPSSSSCQPYPLVFY